MMEIRIIVTGPKNLLIPQFLRYRPRLCMPTGIIICVCACVCGGTRHDWIPEAEGVQEPHKFPVNEEGGCHIFLCSFHSCENLKIDYWNALKMKSGDVGRWLST